MLLRFSSTNLQCDANFDACCAFFPVEQHAGYPWKIQQELWWSAAWQWQWSKKKKTSHGTFSFISCFFIFFFAPFQNTANGFEDNVLCAECGTWNNWSCELLVWICQFMGREVVRLRQQLDHLQNSQRYLPDSFSERKRFQSEQGKDK